MRLCIIVLCISGAAFFSAAQAKTMFVTDTCTINVRVQPGEEYRVMDQLAADETVDVLETQDKWARISFKGGLEGWMLAQYLTAEKPKTMRIADLEKQLQDQAARMNELEKENLSLKGEKLAFDQTLNTLSVENQKLKQEPYQLMLLLSGGGIFLVGCITALILQSIGGRKKGRGGLSFDKGIGF
jgi:SH3 domain protein